ncbi:MAG: hypothetical protein ACHP8B_05055 [Terriglobales bacterium]
MGRLAVIAACLLLISSGSLAQDWKQVRKADESKWAKETGLYPKTIHDLWRRASHAANEKDDDSRIADLDVQGLSDRNQVLLVTYAGEKNCLTLTVFRQYSEIAFSKLWSVEKGPDGQGFCDSPFGSASADVVKSVIQVRVPQAPDASNGYANYVVFDYEWNGLTYRFTGQRAEQGR